jgi:hypothetical protein
LSEIRLGKKIVSRIVMNGQVFYGPQSSCNWDVTPCILVEIYGHSEEACCLRLHGRRIPRKRRQHIPPKRQLFHISTPLHSVNSFHATRPNLVAIILICSSKNMFLSNSTFLSDWTTERFDTVLIQFMLHVSSTSLSLIWVSYNIWHPVPVVARSKA